MRRTIKDKETLVSLVPTWAGRNFSFDVETSGLEWRKDDLLGLALYFENGDAYYIVLAHTTPTWEEGKHYHHTFIEPADFTALMRPIFSQEGVLMVAHNAKFDMHFLHRYNTRVQGRLADTLLAAQLLDENRDNGLKELAYLVGMTYDKYETMAEYKGFKKNEILGVPLDKVAQYAMNDVETTWKLYKLFAQQLQDEVFRDTSLLDVYNDIWMPLLVVLQQMEERGIALDIEKVKEIRDEYVATADKHLRSFTNAAAQLVLSHYGDDIPSMYLKAATEIDLEDAYETMEGLSVVERDGVRYPIITHDMVGKTKSWKPRILTINPASNPQLADIVYNLSGITMPADVFLKEGKSGGISADKDNLQTIIFYLGDRTPQHIRDLLTWRKANKFITTYLDRFLSDADPTDFNKISTWFAMAADDSGEGGTATGRLSSRGPNLQNIPSRGEVGKKARSMFIARPDHKLLVCDLGQAELRLLAHYSGDESLRQAFEEGRDLHIMTGAGFAQISYEELKERYDRGEQEAKDLRALGKTGNFALTYGMGPIKFQRYLIVNNNYETTVEQAREWIEGYNATYAGATAWKKRVVAFAKRNGFVVTFAGRKRRVPDINSRNRKASSYAERQAINAVIQGGVGDIICKAMVHIHPALRGIGGTILLQVHDELVAEVPTTYIDLGKEIMETLMVKYCNPFLRVPQVADCGVGDSWGDAKG